MRLFHGTSEAAAAKIRASGIVRGPVFLTPRRGVADDYSDGAVIEVSVDPADLLIDCDFPAAQLLSVEDANEYLGREGWTIGDYLAAGQSVGVAHDLPVEG